MRIRNQVWLESDKFIVITLHEPYWSAWQKYNWEKGIEGIGISLEAIDVARSKKKRIRVKILKYGAYEISPKKALEVAAEYQYIARDRKKLVVIPRTAFDRIAFEKEKKEYEEKEHKRAEAIAQAQRLFD